MRSKHSHPMLRKPIPVSRFLREFDEIWKRSGLPGLARVEVGTKHLNRRHRRCGRSYAEVDVRRRHFYFASAVLRLPRANRIGLIGHEVGHVIAGPDGSEDEADSWAEVIVGMRIRYDRRWPDKGLQSGRLLA